MDNLIDDAPDFFVSYNATDTEWAQWIAWHLEQAGYRTVIQAWDFRPGSNFIMEMDRAAGQAKRTLIVLSPNFVASRFTQPEWASAFAKDPTGSYRKIVPVLVAPTDVSGLLEQMVYIDLVGFGRDEAATKLIAGLDPGRSKPTTEPDFPGAISSPAPHPGGPVIRTRRLEWKPTTGDLASKSFEEVLPRGWPSSRPATLEIALVPAEPQSLRVGQLQAVSAEMVEAARASGLFAQPAAVDHAYSADSAYAEVRTTRDSDAAGILLTRAGQRSAWITLPHDTMGSVIDPSQLRPRVASVLQILALLNVPLADRYGFTARVDPLTMVIVGNANVVGGRTSASMRIANNASFPVPMLDTVRGDAIAECANELATELVARVVAALN